MAEKRINDVVVEELVGQEIKSESCYAFLSGVIRGMAELSFTRLGFSATFVTNDERIADYIVKALKLACGETFSVDKSYTDTVYYEGDKFCVGVPVEFSSKLLDRCYIVRNVNDIVDSLPAIFTAKSSERRAYLRGLLLGCGYLKAPKELNISQGTQGKTGAGYMLEFSLNSDMVKKDIIELIAKHALIDKELIGERKSDSRIYMKSSSAIVDFLASIGCNNSVVALEQIITSREMKNSLNRAQNVVLANIDKALDASVKQTEDIILIRDTLGLESLNEGLQEFCRLRLAYPNLTLNELASMSNNKTTKSGMNHRIRRIAEIADGIREEKGLR